MVPLFIEDFTPPQAFRSPSSANLYELLAAPPGAWPYVVLLLPFLLSRTVPVALSCPLLRTVPAALPKSLVAYGTRRFA
jgi:hypothetical protein